MKTTRIREKVRENIWGQPACELLRRELDSLPEQALAIPHEPGGWWHQYVCPEHHTELLFDPAEADALSYVCPHGCRLSGEPYRGAWLVFKHQALARYALQAAAVYAGIGDEEYAALGRKLIAGYAAQFPHYPVHPDAQPWMLKGRAFHQALTEAIWATTLIRGYLLLRDEGAAVWDEADAAAMETFLGLLESSMEQYRHVLIHEKRNPENNYTAWLNAALACVYAARGEKEKLLALVDGEGGLLHHLTIGVKPDQFEFEGSTYYHIFVLRAYFITAEMAERLGVDLYAVRGADGQCFEGMLDVLARLANDLGKLPALHDGPYARVPYAREIAEVFETGLTRYGHARYAPILAEAYRQLYGGPVRTGLEAVVYGTGDWTPTAYRMDQGALDGLEGGARAPSGIPPTDDYSQRRSLLLADSGFVVLRRPGSKLSLLADFGPHGGSHGHYDKLHVSLMHKSGAVAPDRGVVPYGSPLRKGWYAETASHNTVSIGGQSQAPHEGECMRFEEGEEGTHVWLRSDQAYAGTVFDRHLLLTGEWLLDWFEVQTGEAAEIDWWMHGIGEMAPAGSPEAWEAAGRDAGAEGVVLGARGGYSHIRAVNSRKPILTDQDTCLWRMTVDGTEEQVTAAMVLFPGSEAKLVRTPGVSVDPSKPGAGLLHRQRGRSARFIAMYRDGAEPLSLHFREGTAGGAALDIADGNGVRRTVHFTKQAGLRLAEPTRGA
ncbi:heparinase II/III domain-containing protein [Paenibacillus oceani]|uniref:Heparinase II/III family protein n=1 Tax=Paenibacillus oceani TaxID=2772510 RepID=A0A927C9U0_9BACL|nr:heparinase II/III family protein [Paenibacillus oceani]MBD2862657.1 heparinase II/III family protein [Paenibacillus oceani]